MNTQIVNTNSERFILAATVAVGILLFVLSTPSFGQTEQVERVTSRDALTAAGFMTNGEISDDLDGNDDEYFYKLKVVAGKLTLTLEITANETNAGAMLDLFGVNDKVILSNVLVQAANGGTERVSKSVNLAKAQDIIIRIKGLKYGTSGSYPGIYKIRLEGPAVNFRTATPATGPVDVIKPDAAPFNGPLEVKKPDEASIEKTDQNTKPDAPKSDGTDQDEKPDEVSTDKTDQNKKPEVPQPDATGQDKKPTATATDKTVQNKKPDAVDRVIEKGKAKSNKFLELLNKVKAKIPD